MLENQPLSWTDGLTIGQVLATIMRKFPNCEAIYRELNFKEQKTV